MALPVITVDDFIGWVKINTNQYKAAELENYISRFREFYLRQIVGDGAYKDIEDQARQKWTDILKGVYFEDNQGSRRFMPGLKNALIYFIYFEFIRDNFEPTQAGQVQNAFENSMRSPDLSTLNVARSRYNTAALQINNNFEDFLRVFKELSASVTSSTDNGDNTYLLTVANTKYLETGDVLTIDGMEYEALEVVENTSILIDAEEVGLDFTGETIIWKPYKEVVFECLEPCGI